MASDQLNAALAYARKGWPIFPCKIDKTPYTHNGVFDATTDEKQIKDWWAKWPGANVAVDCGAANLLVIDYDYGATKKDVEHNLGTKLPPTLLSQKTPSGGTHDFYALSEEDDPVSNSSGRLAPNVDVRSFHGYVLLPPSRTAKGEYKWIFNKKPAYRTEELLVKAKRPKERDEKHDEWIIEPDLEENVSRATRWLEGKEEIGGKVCQTAIEGQGGDNTTYATAAMMKSFGVSPLKALELMWDHWNPRCDPPWDYEELERKVANGYSYNTSPPGNITPSYHVAKTRDFFRPRVQETGEGKLYTGGRFRFADREAVEAIRPPDWLIEDLLPEGAYALLVGASRSLKTFIALDLAMTVAGGGEKYWEGENWKGQWTPPEETGPVLFVVGEGRSNIGTRMKAWEEYHNDGNKVNNIILADPVPRVQDDEQAIDSFIETALEIYPDGYKLIVMDTVGRSMQGVNENAQEHASAFTGLVERLQRELNSAVLALHHSGHAEKTRGRGSSVFIADPDTIIAADREGIEMLVTLSMLKQKDAPEWEQHKYVEALEYRLDLETTTLVMRTPDKEVLKKTKAAKKKTKPEDGDLGDMTAEGKVKMSIRSNIVLEVLKARRGMRFSDRALAKEIAAYNAATQNKEFEDEWNTSENTIRVHWLPSLRAWKGSSVAIYYSNKEWCYMGEEYDDDD